MDKVTIWAYSIHRDVLRLEDYAHLIAPARLQQLRRFRPDDQLRSLCGDLLVLKALTACALIPPTPLQYAVSEHGKPFLPDFPDFHFNVSHSGNWVICATGHVPVGIDIQQERPVKPALFRALSSHEQAFLHTLPDRKRQAAFFDLWCLKEAYCKATGMGLLVPLRSFTVSLRPTAVSDASYCLKSIPFPVSEYHVGLCVKGPEVPQTELHIVSHIK